MIDECQYLKNPKAGRTKTLYGNRLDNKGLLADVPHVYLLSGKSFVSNCSEIFTHVRALQPDLIPSKKGETMGYWEFIQRFCYYRESPFGPQVYGNTNLG